MGHSWGGVTSQTASAEFTAVLIYTNEMHTSIIGDSKIFPLADDITWLRRMYEYRHSIQKYSPRVKLIICRK